MARRLYQSDELDIADGEPEECVSRGEDGGWVKAWVYVDYAAVAEPDVETLARRLEAHINRDLELVARLREAAKTLPRRSAAAWLTAPVDTVIQEALTTLYGVAGEDDPECVASSQKARAELYRRCDAAGVERAALEELLNRPEDGLSVWQVDTRIRAVKALLNRASGGGNVGHEPRSPIPEGG